MHVCASMSIWQVCLYVQYVCRLSRVYTWVCVELGGMVVIQVRSGMGGLNLRTMEKIAIAKADRHIGKNRVMTHSARGSNALK